MVDELELLIENPIEIKSKKNRRQAESIIGIWELLMEKWLEIKKWEKW